MSDFDTEIKQEFISEALINLEEAEDSFMALESSSEPKPLLDKIFRLAHNLKGGSRAVGFPTVAEFTHELENLVQKLQKGEVNLSSAVVTTLLRSNDHLVEMLTALKGNLDAKFEKSDLLAEIQAWITGEQPTAEPLAKPESSVAKPAAKTVEKSGNDDEIIRVSLARINLLNDYVGELIVLQSVIQQQVSEMPSLKLQASIRQMVKISKEIQGFSMSLRMLPVKPLVQKLQRVLRDTSKALNKEAVFEVTGDQMDIDKSVLDRLVDPLIHILRNSVDHGLETPEERLKAGKSAQGAVSLEFFNEGNHLIVEVKDDGKGIDTEVIRKKAIDKGLISENQPLSEKQLVHLIFHPGFSTKAEASEISGRGVGMDVVKTNIEKVGGQVDVQTMVGKGSTFRLQIPLSLAVIDGLVVLSAKSRYVIPLSQVHETVNLKSQKVFLQKPGMGNCFDLRGTVVPLFSAEEALGAQGKSTDVSGTALIVSINDRPIGFVVKDIVQAQQIVIKPLGNGIVPQKGWIGSCVLGDGLPTLILSPVDLLSEKVTYRFAEPTPTISGEVA